MVGILEAARALVLQDVSRNKPSTTAIAGIKRAARICGNRLFPPHGVALLYPLANSIGG
jgi:hypothetical protein